MSHVFVSLATSLVWGVIFVGYVLDTRSIFDRAYQLGLKHGLDRAESTFRLNELYRRREELRQIMAAAESATQPEAKA